MANIDPQDPNKPVIWDNSTGTFTITQTSSSTTAVPGSYVPITFGGSSLPASGTYTTSGTYTWPTAAEVATPTAPPAATKPPLFADSATIRAALRKQLEVMEDLLDDLEGEMAGYISDSIYYLKESIRELDKVSS